MSNQLSKIMALFFAMFCTQVMANSVVSIVASGQTSVSVPQSTLAAIYYTVTNNSSRNLTLNLEPLQGITQSVAGGPMVCGQPIILPPTGSCLLTLIANGNNLPNSPVTGLRLYRNTKASKVYSMPPPGQDIYVTKGTNTPELVVISGEPVTLYQAPNTNPPSTPVTKVLTIQNASPHLIVHTLTVELTFMSQGNPNDVLINASDCNRAEGLLPGQTCVINFTPAMLTPPISAAEKFEVILSANQSSRAQATAHLTLNPPVPITYSSMLYSDNPQIVPFPLSSGNLELTLKNISNDVQTLSFTPPSHWAGVSYIGCTTPVAPNMSCTLTFTSTRANYAGLFSITATSSTDYKSNILVPVAFADADNNLVYSVNTFASTYSAVNTSNIALISPTNVGYQWCPSGMASPCNITTNATSLYNGMSNTLAITSTFSLYPINTYAAGYCTSIPSGTLNLGYYLPSICELGDKFQGAGCNPNTNNIYSNLIQYGFLSNFNGPFWSSTEINAGASWLEFFYVPSIAWQYEYLTNFYSSVVCVTQGNL